MEEQKSLQNTPVSDDQTPQKITPYEMLLRQSRKMGSLATRTYDVTKEFLKQDVSSIHPDRILFGTSASSKKTSKANRQGSEASHKSAEENAEDDRIAEGDREQSERDARTLDPRDSLRRIVQKSHQMLAGAQTVILPMNLFPDTVIVDRTKVTITKRSFFWTSNVISIRIEDVLNVSISTGPIFGSLTISSRVMNSTDHYEIDYFWRKDALYLKQIIQGYMIAQHNRIDTSHLNRKELINTLLELGRDSAF